MKYAHFIVGFALLLSPLPTLAAATLADTPNVLTNATGGAQQNPSFSYTTPSGTSQVFWILVSGDNPAPTADIGGAALTIVRNHVAGGRCGNILTLNYIGYRINPPTGTNTVTYHKGGATYAGITYFTTNGTDQTTPLDAYYCSDGSSANLFTSTTTPSANDLMIALGHRQSGTTVTSHGAGQTEFVNNDDGTFFRHGGSYVTGSSTTNTLQGMSENWSASGSWEIQMIAVKAAAAAVSDGNNDDAQWFLLLFVLPPLRKKNELV
jgi:hypothetical protein